MCTFLKCLTLSVSIPGLVVVECARHIDLKTRIIEHIKRRDAGKTREETVSPSPLRNNHYTLRDILTRNKIIEERNAKEINFDDDELNKSNNERRRTRRKSESEVEEAENIVGLKVEVNTKC